LKPYRQWLFIYLLVFISSCATTGTAKITPEEVWEIESRVKANRYYSALKLSGRVFLKDSLFGSGWTGTDASVAVSRPYSFRATFHSRVGGAWFFAVSNRDEIGLSIPARGVRQVWPRKGDGTSGIVKIGSLEISGDDFTRFVYPGLDGEWVRGGEGRLIGGTLTVTYPGVEYLIRFDGQKRMEAVEIKRNKSKTITVGYSYGYFYPEGDAAEGVGLQSVGVAFDDLVKFDFTKIVPAESLPDSLFQTPAGL
jgi:hypothetical protein